MYISTIRSRKKNVGLSLLSIIKNLRNKIVEKLSPDSCFINPLVIPTETDYTKCPCEGFLKVQKTQERKVTLLDFGELTFKETFKQCIDCKSVFGSETLRALVPEYSNFGFDVMEFAGRKLFIENYTEDEVFNMITGRNVGISPREIAVLGKKFIIHLALAHKDKESEVREIIQKNGGYIAHLDGTCDGASPHFFCALEEVLKLVLLSKKIPSESAELIIPILQELKAAYGTPLAIVCDMSKAIINAIEAVFPGIRIFICHFHWLRDAGKDILKNDHDFLVSILRDYEVKPTLSKFSRELRDLIRNYSYLSQHLEVPVKDIFNQKLPEEVLAHLLIEWIQNYSVDLAGYGFPFDRAHLAQVLRMEEAYKHLQKLTLKPSDRLIRIRNFLEEVLSDADLQQCVKSLKKKAAHFDRLREIMRIAPEEGKDGLNDDGGEVNMPKMKKELEVFAQLEELKQAALVDIGYKKLLKQIEKYKERLFTSGIEVVNAQGVKQHIQPERTNNLCEQFFRGEKRGVRKRTGCKSMSRIFKTMIAETPYVKNLENAEYLKIILNGRTTLAERFSEIDSELVRQAMKQHEEDLDKLKPCIKKTIEDDNFLSNITQAYASC